MLLEQSIYVKDALTSPSTGDAAIVKMIPSKPMCVEGKRSPFLQLPEFILTTFSLHRLPTTRTLCRS